ncbi:MAG: nuclear transport factor 2 family protein [Pseudomonadota bacterium]
MKLAIPVLVVTAGLLAVDGRAADCEVERIRETVTAYLDGTSKGKPEQVRDAFLPSLEVQYLGERDVLLRRTAEDYIRRIEPGVSVPREGRIVSIDTTGKAAAVKAEILWNGRRYTDYMLLLKVEGKWRISNKIAVWEMIYE